MVARAEVDAVQPVDRVAAVGHRENDEAPVGGDARAHHPRGIGRRLEAEDVLRLRRAHDVVVELLVDVRVRLGAQLAPLPGRGRRVAVVEEAAAVVRPREARELDVAQLVGQVLGLGAVGLDFEHLDGHPVGAAAGERVRHHRAVLGERVARERHRAVRGELVGIEQHAPGVLPGGVGGRVHHRLRLQARVAHEVVAVVLFSV
mmetsp:Transcript_6519/g.26563  ORF Transcript_6519/g.26563 Transcript_6519/m.26563 type:complete len:203 (+) Transcript_6519:1427-2035(+)